jgi:D-sedoheptulose 7-phosphate isomerase
MENRLNKHIDLLVERYPVLIECKADIIRAYKCLEATYTNDCKLLVCGNGGSASDSEHIVGELMKEFKLKRKINIEQAKALQTIDPELGIILSDHLQGALPAITLTAQSSLITAFMNDCEPTLVFAQQVNGYGRNGDCFLGISTSGNSMNVLYAAVTAKAKGLKIIGLTGQKKSKLFDLADVCIRVPEIETYKIQELHLPVYHCICLMLEDHFFGS